MCFFRVLRCFCYIVEWWGSCHLPLFLLGFHLHLRDPVRLNFYALVDELFTCDSAGSGFKLCDPFFSVFNLKRVSHVFSAYYISF